MVKTLYLIIFKLWYKRTSLTVNGEIEARTPSTTTPNSPRIGIETQSHIRDLLSLLLLDLPGRRPMIVSRGGQYLKKCLRVLLVLMRTRNVPSLQGERSCIDKGDFMSRSRSLYCHSDTGPTGSTALILREKIRSSLSRPFTLGRLSEITWLTFKAPSFQYS